MWLDGDIDQGELHVNLKLSGAGEQIGLFALDGFTPVDTLSFQTQTENISYGRINDGGSEWKYFSNPTPGMSNNVENQPPIKEYFITCDPDSLTYIYQNYRDDIYIPITFSHGARTWSDVRMRIRGETSRRYPKKSLRIVFDSQPFSNGRDVLIFNAEYFDKSYMNQFITSKLFRSSFPDISFVIFCQ